MPKYSPSIHRVKINTWGTKDKPGSGLDNFVEQELFGGNVGHASIEMTLPITLETQQMIEKYCMKETFEQWKSKKPTDRVNASFIDYIQNGKQIIPVQPILDVNSRSIFNDDGKLVIDEDKKAFKAMYYKIDFSFWPARGKARFRLSNLEDDMEDERKGRHFEYSDEAKEYIKPEERIHKGIIGSRSMTYAPLGISAQRNMSDEEFKKIGLFIELQKITEALEVKGILVSKVKELKVPKIDGSLNKIFYNIGLESAPLIK